MFERFFEGLTKNTLDFDDPLVRMMRVEYPTEYNSAQKLGTVIDRKYAENFLKSR